MIVQNFLSVIKTKTIIHNVTPDIAVALKLNLWKEQISYILFFNEEWYGKRTNIWYLVFLGENGLVLRSRHLVLWSIGTLTSQ
jgi:hypothetical protein